MNNLSVYKANNLIDASYSLKTQAQKLILTCLSKIDSRNEIPKEITLTATEFSKIMKIDPKNAHRELYKAADALFKSSVLLQTEYDKTEIHWVQKRVTKLKGEGAITLTWSDDIVEYISQLQFHFTGYKISNIASLKSPHSIRIYELLMRFKTTGERFVFIDNFKYALGIADKYREFKALNQSVIKPAIKELNELSDLTVSNEIVKNGRKVTGLAFSFKKRI